MYIVSYWVKTLIIKELALIKMVKKENPASCRSSSRLVEL